MTAELLLIRDADCDIAGDGRTVEGLAFHWELPSKVTDDGRRFYWEEFAQRCADQTTKLRSRPLPVFVKHRYLEGSVAEVVFHKATEGLAFVARMTDSAHARRTLEDIPDPFGSVSLGYRSIRKRERRDARLGVVTRREEIAIREMSFSERGQHAGAGVLAVRSADSLTPRLDAARRRRSMLVLP